MAKKVVIGMSGGVDSSVAAYLLKKQGYDVVGVTMQIWQDEEIAVQEENGGCCGLSAVDDARRVAQKLDIPYYVMNFKMEFKENVIDYFIREYLEARTPNPCIACNRYVKWEALLKRSLEIGADYIATGHYARIKKLPNGRFTLQQSAALAKDQTYALYNLTQEQLSHTLMPAGEYTKEEIRKIAEEAGIPVANKPDSQEICFVQDNDYAKYIENTTGQKLPEGNFVDLEGNQKAGTRKRTSEILMHLEMMKAQPKAISCVHAHPPHATAFAVARIQPPTCMIPEMEILVGEAPVANYSTPGSKEMGQSVAALVQDHNTILMANHGVVTWGTGVEDAYWKMEIVDAYCRTIVFATQLGTELKTISKDKVRDLLNIKKGMGIPDRRYNLKECELCDNSEWHPGVVCGIPPQKNDETSPTDIQAEELVKTITQMVMNKLKG